MSSTINIVPVNGTGCYFTKSDFSQTNEAVFVTLNYNVATINWDGSISTSAVPIHPPRPSNLAYGDGESYGLNPPKDANNPWNYPRYSGT